jgi:hypothetical protein
MARGAYVKKLTRLNNKMGTSMILLIPNIYVCNQGRASNVNESIPQLKSNATSQTLTSDLISVMSVNADSRLAAV